MNKVVDDKNCKKCSNKIRKGEVYLKEEIICEKCVYNMSKEELVARMLYYLMDIAE